MLTLATCSFNTPEVTMNMIKSFMKFHKNTSDFTPYRILVSENSTNEKTINRLKLWDINYLRNPGFHHSIGVDALIDACKTKYMLLVDTDILFLKNIDDLFKRFKKTDSAICGVLQGDRGGMKLYDRVCPWFCFIDIDKIKSSGIRFFDTTRFSQHLTEQISNPKIYDVGATFLEDILNSGLSAFFISEEEESQYVKHFEGMSWRKDCGIESLVNLANQVEQQYYNVINQMEL